MLGTSEISRARPFVQYEVSCCVSIAYFVFSLIYKDCGMGGATEEYDLLGQRMSMTS